MATTEMPNWFVTQFNKRAHHIYQAKGNRLKGTVAPADRVEGEKAKWRLIGKGEATEFQRGQRATPANTGRGVVEAPLKTFQFFDEVHDFDADRAADPNNAQEKEKIFQQGGMALGRKADREILGAINALAPVAGASFIDIGTDAFTAAHALAMCQRLQAKDIPWEGEVFCGLPSLLWNQLLSAKQVNSAEHIGQDLPFVKATDTRFWNGVNWFLFSDQYFPVPAANKVDVFLWHKEAVGHAPHTDLNTTWQWDNRLTCWTLNMLSKAANVGLQADGIVRLRAPTNTPITLN
ncbi:phage capsid protein [Ancylobacter sp. A5.8]|uniref:phage capsid protein n=1 Tax=Ancylobacter gelatini TaxID=2919920 RepID=UPI001F4DAB8D|nr:phage capsid protein [Ancylobacter gelatini]MCJ8143817.1 phage capsid protein [Ancylobacter gelatini]